MKKIVFGIIIVISSVVAVQRSEAIGGESLGCFVNVGVPGVFIQGGCVAERPQSSYDIVFHVLGGAGTYSYAWTKNKGTIVDGCTASTDYCILNVPGNMAQHIVTVSVTLSQSGLQHTVSATAEIEPVCGNQFC